MISGLLAASLGVASVVAGAGMASDKYYGGAYLTNTDHRIVHSGQGLCWRTSAWTPADANVADCAAAEANAASLSGAGLDTMYAAFGYADAPRLEAKTLFDTDKAVIRPEGKVALNTLLADLQRAGDKHVIIVTGHADRRGGLGYNMRLSLRRAASVKRFLVAGGITPERIQTQGRGKTQPMTKQGDCTAMKGQALSDCLQPDRRAIIETSTALPA
jgi:OOP family OmpA-OmpF porin